MSSPTNDSALDYRDPLAVLKYCHDSIRKLLQTLQDLSARLPEHGADADARQAAQSLLKYFNHGAHLHHEDEEENLLPMLQATAQGADAALLAQLTPAILASHEQMNSDWNIIKPQLEQISQGQGASLSAADVRRFCVAYHAHIAQEETHIAPMARRLFSGGQMAELGGAMQARRGITPVILPTPAQPADDGPDGKTLADLRRDYGRASLTEAEVLDDPIAQFGKWFEEALHAQAAEANAMSLATVDADGKPSSRIVLIKQYDADGFVWFTNYGSPKGHDLETNPNAALLFFWSELERQVRIEGRIVKTSAEVNDKYFYSRPLQSQIGAIASRQSAPIASREQLEANYDAAAAASGVHPVRPENWGGYRLDPVRIEFWQGRRSRFHDRIVYLKQADGRWIKERLQP